MNKMKSNNKKVIDSFKNAQSVCNNLGLTFNFRGVKFLLDTDGITFGQLRVGQFFINNRLVIDYMLAAYYLVAAGLASTNQVDRDEIYNRAFEIVTNWQAKVGSLELLWVILITQVEDLHFFIDSLNMEETSVQSKNVQDVLRRSKITKTLQLQSIGMILRGTRLKTFSPTLKL